MNVLLLHGILVILLFLLTALTAVNVVRICRFAAVADQWVTFFVTFIFLMMASVFLLGCAAPGLRWPWLLGLHVLIGGLSAWLVTMRKLPLWPSAPATPWKLRLTRVEWSYLVLLAAGFLLTGYLGWLLPPYSSDGLGYHLVSVANWVHSHQIVDMPGAIYANVYPKDAELLYTWLYVAAGNDSLVHLGQWLFALLGVVAAAACARQLGISRTGAVTAGTLFFFTPTVLIQTTTAYTDVAFASVFLAFFYFYLRYLQHQDVRFALLGGMSGGILLGLKSTAMLYVGVCAVVLVIHACIQVRQRRQAVGQAVVYGLIWALPIVVLGAYWYVRTWVFYGNPVYPFTVTLLGHSLFPGLGTMKQMILVPNTPVQLLHLSAWRRVVAAWFSITTFYSYDMPIGGFGVQWFIELPCLLAATVLAAVRRRWFWIVVLPLWLIFFLQPANWWARYTLFMVPFAGWCIAGLVDKVKSRAARNTLYMIPFTVAGLSVVTGIVLFTCFPLAFSGSVLGAVRAAMATPPSERTVGRVVAPEYAWVDTVPPSATLGMTINVPFRYPLFGKSAQHSVFIVDDHDESAFLNAMRAKHIQYLMVVRTDPANAWAKQHPETFRVYNSSTHYVVYQVRKEPLQ